MSIVTTINTACFVSWVFLLLLPLCYLFIRWRNKYDVLEDSFNEKSLELYYKLFKTALIIQGEKSYKNSFKEDYYRWYGRRNFIIPLLAFGLVAAIGIYSLDRTVINLVNPEHGFRLFPPIALAAFLGAYMWIGFDQVQRIRTQDFTFHDIHKWTFRFIIAIPIAYAFSYAVKEPVAIPVAFLLGAFPLKLIMKYSKRLTDKYLKLDHDKEMQSSDLQNLQGVDRTESERIQEEGITNILQLAYCDPIDLAMRSTLDFSYVIDIKSQALLWIYIGNNLDDKLRSLGLRGAHEARVLNIFLEETDKGMVDVANKNLNEISNLIGINSKAFKKTLKEVSGDPHAMFLYEIWCPDEFSTCLDGK